MEFGIVKWFRSPEASVSSCPTARTHTIMFRQETAALRDLNPAYDRSGSKPGLSPWDRTSASAECRHGPPVVALSLAVCAARSRR